MHAIVYGGMLLVADFRGEFFESFLKAHERECTARKKQEIEDERDRLIFEAQDRNESCVVLRDGDLLTAIRHRRVTFDDLVAGRVIGVVHHIPGSGKGLRP